MVPSLLLTYGGMVFYKSHWHDNSFCWHGTAWKVSVYGVILVCIFSHSDWIRRDTSYFSVFSSNAGKYGQEKLRILALFTQCGVVPCLQIHGGFIRIIKFIWILFQILPFDLSYHNSCWKEVFLKSQNIIMMTSSVSFKLVRT